MNRRTFRNRKFLEKAHPMIEPRKDVQWTPPAIQGEQCKNCRHWLADQARDHAMGQSPSGIAWTPIEEARKHLAKDGQVMDLSKMVTASMAFCTYLPTWTLKGSEQ